MGSLNSGVKIRDAIVGGVVMKRESNVGNELRSSEMEQRKVDRAPKAIWMYSHPTCITVASTLRKLNIVSICNVQTSTIMASALVRISVYVPHRQLRVKLLHDSYSSRLIHISCHDFPYQGASLDRSLFINILTIT